jgi:hypothetical protein
MTRNHRPAKPKDSDIELTAGAEVRELHFKKVPETEVRFHGSPDHVSASGSERENLPDTVERGVTYRNAGIRWRATSKLVVDDRLLEALDEAKAGGHDFARDPPPLQQSSGVQKPAEKEEKLPKAHRTFSSRSRIRP